MTRLWKVVGDEELQYQGCYALARLTQAPAGGASDSSGEAGDKVKKARDIVRQNDVRNTHTPCRACSDCLKSMTPCFVAAQGVAAVLAGMKKHKESYRLHVWASQLFVNLAKDKEHRRQVGPHSSSSSPFAAQWNTHTYVSYTHLWSSLA